MNTPTIQCPHCEGEITLSETLAADHIEAAQAKHRQEVAELKAVHAQQAQAIVEREAKVVQAEQQIQQTLASERSALSKTIEQQVRQDVQLRLDEADKRIAEKDEKIKQAEKLELASRQRMAEADEKSRKADLEVQRRLDEQRKSWEQASAEREQALQKQVAEREAAVAQSEKAIAQTVEAERQKMSAELLEKVKKDFNLQLQNADEQVAELNKKLSESRAIELDALKRIREADDKLVQSELEVQRRLDAEKKQIREQALKEADEKSTRDLAEKDKQLERVNTQIEDMKRQMESRSQELQGELEEDNVYTRLREAFPQDDIVRTPRGRNGADIEIRIKSVSGKTAGTVLIEVKDTQSFDRKWIGKLKQDMQAQQAVQGVIVSRAMPGHIDTFDQCDGIWVTRIDAVVPLLRALRSEVLALFRERTINALSDSAKDKVFEYLTSADFARRISMLVDNYQALRHSMDTQKKQFARRMNEQEHALDNMFAGISNVYSDLGLRVGASLKPVQGLEVDDPADQAPVLLSPANSDATEDTSAA